MTGPEHYQKAETFLLVVREANTNTPGGAALADQFLRAAQVHATLALAAATAMAAVPSDESGMDHSDFDAWDAACGEHG